MTKGEIAAYLGMANVLFATIPLDESGDEMISNVRQALLESQLIITQLAIEEFSNGQPKPNE